ncbi:hypothetical protein [Streptomyces reniochalinae]|uniref:hypothetical protein n=1 Tax=Streptomyces reniochalinae TaxID=2250578 RepID=UPI0011C075A6|nr:hypothetical protein [Streptomyces reniochalinae]
MTGSQSPLSSKFIQQLPGYAQRAKEISSCLMIVATEYVAGPLLTPGQSEAAVPTIKVDRPQPVDVVRRRIETAPDPVQRSRVAWLQSGQSDFAELLNGDESPGEAVRLAEIMLAADGPNDREAVDQYRGWKHKLTEWFGGDDESAPAVRARQIAAACLDGADGRIVLDAADLLLPYEEFNWPRSIGGPLAGADEAQRCEAADLHFANGKISINHKRPGAGPALLRHVWRTRPQVVPLLRRWLGEISGPKGIAAGYLDKIAEALGSVAESEGVGVVLELIEQWLEADSAQHTNLACDVLAQLSLDPANGARVRQELGGWAKAITKPDRQRAVITVCRGKMGKEYPSIALKRMQYVLERESGESIRQEAVTTVAVLLTDPDQGARTLKTLSDWATGDVPDGRHRTLFLNAFDQSGSALEERNTDPALGLLARDGELGQAVQSLLQKGWGAVWASPGLRPRASRVLARWAAAAEAGLLPADAVEAVISAIFAEQADALSDDLDRVIGGEGAFRRQLRGAFVQTVRDRADRGSRDEARQVA